MATKPQAKAAIDSTVTLVKADIDLLPAGVNIRRGSISFGPMSWGFICDAEGSSATATSQASAIMAAFAARNPILQYFRRADDNEPERAIVITATTLTIRIVNF
jgi:hypothetical protein